MYSRQRRKDSSKRILSNCLCILSICFVLKVECQSTTINPQGHCASYLNRYTTKEQCVYSFIVPKKDRDQCPGLANQVNDLKDQIREITNWKKYVDTNIRLLRDNDQRSRELGNAEAQVQILSYRNNNLTAGNNYLRNELSKKQSEANRLTISWEDAKTQIRGYKSRQGPLERNYTQLKAEFQKLRERLADMKEQFDKQEEKFKVLRNAKNCSDVNKHLPSCAVIKQWGYTTSGDAMIDPDGEGGVDPFMVYCDMDSDPSTGITIIKNDIQPKHPVSGCEQAGCFSLPVNYNGVTLAQISKLMSISLACEQFIRYDCFDSKLLKHDTAWWVSRTGRKQRYWGGAAPGSNKCACGMDNSCVTRNEVCNCDADSEEWLFDEGFLRDKTTLPVTNLNFGDVNDKAGERGNVTIGALKCKWNRNMSVPSCDALLKAGVTGSGMFMVDADGKGPLPPTRTLCNLPDFITGSSLNGSAIQGTSVVMSSNPNEYVFTDCGETYGNVGPTELACNTTYRGTNLKVRVRDGTQIWRVPKTGRYRIRAMAPSGYHAGGAAKAGRGADMQAEFTLKKNTEIRVVVGQKGFRHAGSGGTFVIKMIGSYTMQPLLVAGAGGSTNNKRTSQSVVDANQRENGKHSSSSTQENFGAGGSNGGGGYRGGGLTGPNTSGGGAGFNENGAKSSDDRFTPLPTKAIKINTNGFGNLASGRGGTYTYITYGGENIALHGGFGGGGSASKNGPGGAGGHSGGGGGPSLGYSGAGGSYYRATDAKEYVFNFNLRANGGVRIIYLGASSAADDEELTS